MHAFSRRPVNYTVYTDNNNNNHNNHDDHEHRLNQKHYFLLPLRPPVKSARESAFEPPYANHSTRPDLLPPVSSFVLIIPQSRVPSCFPPTFSPLLLFCPQIPFIQFRTMLNPVFGKISADHGYRRALLVASILVMVGAVLYAAAGNEVELILAHLIMGAGAGTLGVTRAYMIDKSTELQRTTLLDCTL